MRKNKVKQATAIIISVVMIAAMVIPMFMI